MVTMNCSCGRRSSQDTGFRVLKSFDCRTSIFSITPVTESPWAPKRTLGAEVVKYRNIAASAAAGGTPPGVGIANELAAVKSGSVGVLLVLVLDMVGVLISGGGPGAGWVGEVC